MRALKRILFLAVVTLFLTSAPSQIDAKLCDGSEICPGTCNLGICSVGGPPSQACKGQGSFCNQYVCTNGC